MFFTSELLEKRDGGFGLLWLAATLGSKSTLKKLPRRDVLTADISQLCNLIIQPAEPLALRLTSNLMVGVARVYKVKEEIFMTDVTTCFNSLKKMVHEIQIATDAQLQMAQPTLKSSALTLEAAHDLSFEYFIADWDEYLNISGDGHHKSDDADADFDPSSTKPKHRTKPPSATERPRVDAHTLLEHHEHLLSSSLDLSFNDSFVGGPNPSSSQIDGGFAFNDDFFGPSGALDIGAVGDELARELGEGWGASPVKDNHAMDVDPSYAAFEGGDMILGQDFDFGISPHHDGAHDGGRQPEKTPILNRETPAPCTPSKKRKAPGSDKENMPPPPVPNMSTAPSPATSFSRLLLSQDEYQPEPLADITILNRNQENATIKKVKKTRLLLDARTELTDEELKTARAQYLRGQYVLKQELGFKKAEKDGVKLVEGILWGPPQGMQAPSLVDFWQENFRVQVEARTGVLHIHPPDEQSPKRRKIRHETLQNQADHAIVPNFDIGMPDFNQDFDVMQFDAEGLMDQVDPGRLRSSEEPGQGRNASRPPSVLGDNLDYDFGFQEQQVTSQRSSLFPWDNAGASSSVTGAGFAPFDGSDRISVGQEELKLRGSLSRREDSLVPSQTGSFSPAVVGRSFQLIGEDYAFDLDAEASGQSAANNDNQGSSDMNLIALERNSFNFLEYTRMQYQTLPATTELTYDNVVPNSSSTRHVAAAGFYHCLVLATKKLIRVKQTDPYGMITIAIA